MQNSFDKFNNLSKDEREHPDCDTAIDIRDDETYDEYMDRISLAGEGELYEVGLDY